MVYLQVKLLSMPERFEIYIVYKRRYINTLPFLSRIIQWSTASSDLSHFQCTSEAGTQATTITNQVVILVQRRLPSCGIKRDSSVYQSQYRSAIMLLTATSSGQLCFVAYLARVIDPGSPRSLTLGHSSKTSQQLLTENADWTNVQRTEMSKPRHLKYSSGD